MVLCASGGGKSRYIGTPAGPDAETLSKPFHRLHHPDRHNCGPRRLEQNGVLQGMRAMVRWPGREHGFIRDFPRFGIHGAGSLYRGTVSRYAVNLEDSHRCRNLCRRGGRAVFPDQDSCEESGESLQGNPG